MTKQGIAEKIKGGVTALKKKGFFHIFGASTINKIIGFASSWIIVRIISKAEYGVYTYAYNIYSFILLLSGLGIASAVLQVGSETKDPKEKLRVYSYGIKVGTTVDSCLAILILLIALLVPLAIEGSNRLLMMMFALPLVTVVMELQLMYLRINVKNREYSRITTMNSIAVLAFSCILAYIFKAPGLVLAGYCSHLFTIIVASKRYKIPLKPQKSDFSREEKKGIFSIATISMINNGLSRLMYLLDIFVIGLVIKNSGVIASYKIATNIPTALQFIPTALMVFIYPHFAQNKDNKEWLIRNYKRVILPFGAFNLICSLGMIVFAKPAISLLFGTQYLDAVTPFRILAVGYFFSATFRSLAGSLLVTQRKLKFNLFVSVLSSLMNTGLNVWMILMWGSSGAAVATVITGIVSGAISTAYLLYTFKSKKAKGEA